MGGGWSLSYTDQEIHGSPSPELSPAEHAWHITLPLVVDSRPAGQKIQASPPKLVPNPSASFASRVTYDPAEHVPHWATPSTPLNFPSGQGRHCSLVTAPGSARYVPTGHAVHAPMSQE